RHAGTAPGWRAQRLASPADRHAPHSVHRVCGLSAGAATMLIRLGRQPVVDQRQQLAGTAQLGKLFVRDDHAVLPLERGRRVDEGERVVPELLERDVRDVTAQRVVAAGAVDQDAAQVVDAHGFTHDQLPSWNLRMTTAALKPQRPRASTRAVPTSTWRGTSRTRSMPYSAGTSRVPKVGGITPSWMLTNAATTSSTPPPESRRPVSA